ncbi:mammalian cell entry protein [Robbsia andropogonis]|uniref:Mammalian cell entry protein n=1 Tax=Robbsia andropogonis TaxID=28092 RepID=A0A0F5K0N7_9BURK|nr:mammalian cell entry protein [Robbsia andropogonis]
MPDWQEPVVAPRGRWLPSLVWLVPLIAALIGISLVVRQVVQQGPTITISFKSAEGIESGKTKVKYKDVDIGEVKSVRLADDRSRAIVTVDLTKEAQGFAVKDTRFWIVKPRVAANGISGLNTLLSGSYIGVDAGRSPDSEKEFTGLENPPAVTRDQKGHQYVLKASDLGSLDIGAPVYYRRIQVGQVVAYNLNPDGSGVTLRVFVNAPYDQFVTTNTRFWNASGVDVRLDSGGFKLNTQSLAAVLLGGVAFQAPPNEAPGQVAADNREFRLNADLGTAMKPPDTDPVPVVLNFNQSLRGLTVGANVDFRGITVGEVTHIGVDFDPRKQEILMPVTVNIYPERLGKAFANAIRKDNADRSHQMFITMIRRGLRAQLRTGNLLTGQLYVALDFFPNAPPVSVNYDSEPTELPTLPNTLDELQLQVANIAKKIDKIPFDQIGANVNTALINANKLFDQLNTQVAPQAAQTLQEAKKTFASAQQTLSSDSPLQGDVRQAMRELTRTAQQLSVLADYLERHPEALIRGKTGKDK